MGYGWIIVFLLILLLGRGYVSRHAWRILPFVVADKWIIVGALLLCIVCFFANFILGLDSKSVPIAITLYELSSSAAFIRLYLLLFFLMFDLGRSLHLVPRSSLYNSQTGIVSMVAIMIGLFVYGYFNYLHRGRVPLTLQLAESMKRQHRLVTMTDLYLGYHNCTDEFRKWVDKVSEEQPEAIFIAGNIIDGSIHAFIDQDMAAELRHLKAPVHVRLGNHEYLSGEPRAKKFYQDAGTHPLIDNHCMVSLAGGDLILVVGRDDRTSKKRVGLQHLMKFASKGYYMILVDHQPYYLEEAQQVDIDLQLPGHMYYGQVRPVSRIEDLIHEDAFGSLQRGNIQYYVLPGISIWGGKFRIGTRFEYVVANIKQELTIRFVQSNTFNKLIIA